MKYITYPLNHEATEFYLWKEQGQTICVTYLLKKNTLYKITYNIFTSLCPSCTPCNESHSPGFNDIAESAIPVSLTPLSLQSRCQWHRWVCNPGVNDTAESAIPVSMTPLSLQSRCQWHRWVCNPGFNDNAKSDFRCDNPEIFACENISTKSKPHLKIQ